MKKYQNVEIRICEFAVADILTVSGADVNVTWSDKADKWNGFFTDIFSEE